MTTVDDFKNALVDVRKGYRLLFLYQQRAIELVQFIGDTLTFNYEGGYSWFSANTPKPGKGTLANWSWDWLNMYFYEFHFSTKELEGNKIKFSILLQSDTGFFDTQSNNALDVESFLPAETAETKLIFLLGKNCWHPDFEEDFKDSSTFYKKEFTEYVKNIENKVLIAKGFLLTDFINIDTTQIALLKWVDFCCKNNVREIEILKYM